MLSHEPRGVGSGTMKSCRIRRFGTATIVVFRSAKNRLFAERKTTIVSERIAEFRPHGRSRQPHAHRVAIGKTRVQRTVAIRASAGRTAATTRRPVFRSRGRTGGGGTLRKDAPRVSRAIYPLSPGRRIRLRDRTHGPLIAECQWHTSIRSVTRPKFSPTDALHLTPGTRGDPASLISGNARERRVTLHLPVRILPELGAARTLA